ncbi:MAG: AI-2E family transporter [Chitinophagales bacterium]
MQQPIMPLYQKTSYVLFSILGAGFLLQWCQNLLMPLTLSFLLALALYPFSSWLERKRFPRFLAILVALFFVGVVLSLMAWLLVGQLNNFASEVPLLITKFENLFNDLQIYIEEKSMIDSSGQITMLQDAAMQIFSTATSLATVAFSATSSVLLYLTLIPIYTFLILFYRGNWKKFLFEMTSDEANPRIEQMMTKIVEVIQSYVGGLSTVIFIVATLNCIGLFLLGIKYAFFFGFFAAVLTVIPYFGIAIGALFPTLYTFLITNNIWLAVGVLVIFGIVQTLEGNFITPYVMSSKVSLNPLVIIFGLLLGGFLWGALGMILSLPLMAIINIVLNEVDELRPFAILMSAKIFD